MAYHGTAHWTSTDNNEKLGKIDEGCKAAALHANVSAHPPGPGVFQLRTARIITHLWAGTT